MKPTFIISDWAITDRTAYFVLTGWLTENGREYFHTSTKLLSLDFVLQTAETETAHYVLKEKW